MYNYTASIKTYFIFTLTKSSNHTKKRKFNYYTASWVYKIYKKKTKLDFQPMFMLNDFF